MYIKCILNINFIIMYLYMLYIIIISMKSIEI